MTTNDPTDDALAELGLRRADLDPAAVEAVRRHVEHHDDRPANLAQWLAGELNTPTDGCTCQNTKHLMQTVLEGHEHQPCQVHQRRRRPGLPTMTPDTTASDLARRLNNPEGQTP